MSRVALFGGMFDPPHIGHVAFVETAIECFDLDRVIVAVTGAPPHRGNALASVDERLEMVRAVFATVPAAVVVDWESHAAESGQPAYTADTLDRLVAEYPEHSYMVLVGADQLVALQSWQRWRDIIEHATIGVAVRPGIEESDLSDAIGELCAHGAIIERCSMKPVDVDSTNIRECAADGDLESARRDVPDAINPQVEAIYAGGAANSAASGVH